MRPSAVMLVPDAAMLYPDVDGQSNLNLTRLVKGLVGTEPLGISWVGSSLQALAVIAVEAGGPVNDCFVGSGAPVLVDVEAHSEIILERGGQSRRHRSEVRRRLPARARLAAGPPGRRERHRITFSA